MAELVGIREYARLRGITHGAVQKAIKSGRIAAAVVPTDGGNKIDRERADALWGENTDQAQQREVPAAKPAETKGRDLFGQAEPPRAASTFQTARAMREGFLARKAGLELRALEGSLVPAAEVRAQAFQVARMVRDAVMHVPARVVPELASMRDAHEMQLLLERSLREALTELADVRAGIDKAAE